MIVPAADVRIALTTTGSRDEAENLARLLVDKGLAACVNIVSGLTSIYRWKGETESASEFLLVIKTSAGNVESLEAELRRLHSYDVPEFLVITPEAAGKAYLDWLMGETVCRR
jgi:periplasmic divalent cation tolerance protein